MINLKGSATEQARKAKLLGVEVSHREPKKIDTTNMEEEDEFEDELFEDIDVNKINTEERERRALTSSKLPPLQRIFPLSYEPSMIEDATYSGPPSLALEDTTADKSKDKGKQKANPEKEGLYNKQQKYCASMTHANFSCRTV